MSENILQIGQTKTCFKSITQYDKKFDGMFDQIKNKGYSCSYFSILTCLRFFQGHIPDVDSHEKNIIDAMMITCFLNINSGLLFDDLIIGSTNCDHKKIMATSVDLITNNVIGFDNMFKNITNEKEKYAVIFLKSEKYFVVLVDIDGYYVRDCHMDNQHNYKSKQDLINHLNNSYQFANLINIDGFKLEEYSSIEYLVIDKLFDSNVIDLLEPTSEIVNLVNLVESDHTKNEMIDQMYLDQIAYQTIELMDESTDKDKPTNIDILKGDIFEIPNKTLFSEKDIKYLELLNAELKIYTDPNLQTPLLKNNNVISENKIKYKPKADILIDNDENCDNCDNFVDFS